MPPLTYVFPHEFIPTYASGITRGIYNGTVNIVTTGAAATATTTATATATDADIDTIFINTFVLIISRIRSKRKSVGNITINMIAKLSMRSN